MQPAAAQVMPGPQRPDWATEKSQYAVEALNGFRQLMTDWELAVAENDAPAMARYYSGDATAQLWLGEPLEGRAAIARGLEELLPSIIRVETVVSDFAASGRLFYAFGRYFAQVQSDGGSARAATGTFIMVAEREHRDWRIRSQLFKPAQESGRS